MRGRLTAVRGRAGRPRRRPKTLLADRGYDHDKYRRLVRQRGIKPVIARRQTAHGSGLGHRDDRRGYLGPSHATCNLRAAANKRNGTRQDRQLIWSRVWFEPIPPNVILVKSAALVKATARD